jgi:SP family arabinose:H+ symporter-like MFS transporter
MKKHKLLLWSLTVALSGFLFGLDTAVISGAEQTIQKIWHLNNFTHGLAVSMALYGTVLGAMFGGFFADKLGRKTSLFWIGALFLVSALGSALSQDIYVFMSFRLIGGLCIGASSVVSPLYISEIAPPARRGLLVALFQFNIVFGILIAYVSNYLLQSTNSPNDWRWMLGIVAIPSLIFAFLTLLISESPRWLALKRNDLEGARSVLAEIDPAAADATLASILASRDRAEASPSKAFFSAHYRWPILLAFLLAFFNQLSGINAIIYYAPRIFEMTGLSKSSALLSTAGIGLVNLVFTMLGLSLIDRFGRRVLMYIGSIGYIVSLGLIALAFYRNSFGGMTIFVLAFIAAHAVGQGAVIWVFIGEIFPNEVRAAGQSFGCFTHWMFAAIIANVFPALADRFGGAPIFAFFCGMMVLQLLYVMFMMPETKGIALEDMDTQLAH